jgi:autophagy-related protein 9
MAGENKMEQSFLHFKITNPEWQPSDSAASMLLSRMVDGDSKGSHRLNSPFRLRNGMLRSVQLGAGRPPKAQAEVPFVGTEEERLKQKAMLYEAALQRSLKLQRPSGASKSVQSGPSSRLQPMEERPEVEDEDGWETAKLGTRLNDDDQLRDSIEAESGAGMLGLIHQVIKK